MKQELTSNLFNPLTLALVGANVNDRPNYLVIGYICPFDFSRYLFFSLFKKRYTRIGISENQTFSVNVPSAALIEKLELVGSKSGRDIDKSVLFDNFYGELKNAPMIGQCPINIECEVAQTLDYGVNEGIIGRVVKSYINEEYLSDGTVDWRAVDPLVWTFGQETIYYRLGEVVHGV